MVGAVGGLGGFLLPTLLGLVKQASGSFGPGFAVLAGLAVIALGVARALVAIEHGWRFGAERAPSAEAV